MKIADVLSQYECRVINAEKYIYHILRKNFLSHNGIIYFLLCF
jgi:hypothetical protein